MGYFLNILNRFYLKELLKDNVFSRVSLSLKIVSSMLILAPISWIASIILPGWLSIVGRVVFYGVLLISMLAIVFECKIFDYSSKLEKAIEYNFYSFLKYLGLNENEITHKILMHQLEILFLKDYIKAILDTNLIFSNANDIKRFDFKTAINYNSRLKVIYQDIVNFVNNYNKKFKQKSYNSYNQKYEHNHKNKEFVYSNDYEKALKCFNLSKNFSQDELKKAYRKKIKEVHPDSGGNKETFLLVQKYFELLEKNI